MLMTTVKSKIIKNELTAKHQTAEQTIKIIPFKNLNSAFLI